MQAAQVRRATGWLISLLVCCLAIYRIAEFTPQPLDGPSTLRPLLNKAFISYIHLFATPETAYRAWRFAGLAAMLLVCAVALLNYFGRRSPLSVYFGLMGITLFLCRFPTLLDYQLNPDEGEFLSAAHKLFYNANFFQSVDCGTSGPLNIYPLMLPAALGISPDYASSRLLALAIAYAVIALLYATFREISCDRLARVAVLPAVLVFAGFEEPNLVHYSSEQVSLFLIASAIYLAVRLRCRKEAGVIVACFLLGLLTGCAFFSKMQSVPVVGLAGVGGIFFSGVRRGRALLLFAAGLACLPLANAALCIAGGVWHDFWISYIVSNQRYITQASDPFPLFAGYLIKTPDIRFLVFTFLSIVAALAVIRFRQRRILVPLVALIIAALGIYLSSAGQITSADSFGGFGLLGAVTLCLIWFLFNRPESLSWATLLALALVAAALFSIYRPHRLFPHYLLLLVPPLTFLTGLLIVRLAEADQGTRLAALVIAFAAGNLVYPWTLPLFPHETPTSFRNVVPSVRPPEGDFLRALTRTADRIFVWGWTADPYLGSGRVSAARDLNLFYEFSGNPEITEYYQARLAKDLRRHPPALFIDAVGDESWIARNPKEFGYDRFPEIAWLIRANYFQLPDAYGQHYFLRSDLAERFRTVPPPKHCSPGALRCLEFPARIYTFEASLISSVAYLPPLELPERATLKIDVTPMASEREHATVFAAGATNFRGFRFEYDAEDRYRLVLGLGDRWLSSKPVSLPYGKMSSVEIVMEPDHVWIQVDGQPADKMELPSPLVGSDAPLTIGAGIAEQSRFTGIISFFEIRSPKAVRTQ